MENDEAKKMCIKNNLNKYLNREVFETRMSKENLGVGDYYDKYLGFLGNDLISAIKQFDKEGGFGEKN